MTALESEDAGFVQSFRRMIRQLVHSFDQAHSDAHAKLRLQQLRQDIHRKRLSLSTEQLMACGVPCRGVPPDEALPHVSRMAQRLASRIPAARLLCLGCVPSHRRDGPLSLVRSCGMPKHTLLSEPDHVDEPQQVQEYWGLVSRVAATQHPVVVRRGGAAVAAVIPVAYLELLPGVPGTAGGRAICGPGRLGAGGPGLASSPAMV